MNAVERHPGIALLFIILVLLFAESIIGTERMDRRIEAVQVPACPDCTQPYQRPPYERPEVPVRAWYADAPLRGDE